MDGPLKKSALNQCLEYYRQQFCTRILEVGTTEAG
jgi:hypothetical protein